MTTDMRQHFNFKILEELENMVKAYPELRFHQLLWKCGIFESDVTGGIRDKFYEESEQTFKKLVWLRPKTENT